MRKSRGGRNFELAVERCLQFIDIPVEKPKKSVSEQLKRIDLVIPNEETALRTPDKAVFLTCKRTLRERWKQEIPQIGPNQRVYLITLDENLSKRKAAEIQQQGLIAFVRDELKDQNHSDASHIRKLSDSPTTLDKVVNGR